MELDQSLDRLESADHFAFRTGLRAVLRAVIRRPGALYHPLYIGPIRSGDALKADIQGIAEAEALPVYFEYTKEIAKVLGTGMPALVVLSLHSVVDQIGEIIGQLGRSQQLVIWGNEPDDALPDSVRKILASGLSIDPARLIRRSGGEWSMGPTLMRCAQDPGKLYNPVILVAPFSNLPFVADEAALRLEAGGLQPVLTFSGSVRADEPQVHRLGHGSAIVLRGADPESKDLRLAVEELIRRRTQVVLVVEPVFVETVRDDPDWEPLLERAVTFVLTGLGIGGAAAHKESWPPLADVLVCPPTIGPEPERMMSGLLAKFPLPEVLQTLGAGRHVGRMILFSSERLGTLDLCEGRLVGVWRLGDEREMESLARLRRQSTEEVYRAMLEHFACGMGQWGEAAFTFIQRDCQPKDAWLPLDALAMEIARRADEAPRRIRRAGSMYGVWKARSVHPSVSEIAQTVWARMNGVRTLEEIARELGLFEDEVIDAVLELIEANAIERMFDQKVAAATMIDLIAEQLLAWGLVPEAQRLLAEADHAGKLTPVAGMQLGHLLALSDPQAAASAFRLAANHADRKLDGLLNAALLEVRGRQRDAAAAWAEVRALLLNGIPEQARTARHYAALAELAARAGDLEFARSALRSLRTGNDQARVLAAMIARSIGFVS